VPGGRRRERVGPRTAERVAQAQVSGREGVPLARAPHGDVLSGPFADAAQAPELTDEVVEVDRAVERDGRGGECPDRVGPGRRDPDVVEGGVAQRRRGREECAQPERLDAGNGAP
jgi:hypothetical protein